MPAARLDAETIAATLAAYHAAGCNKSAAARALGLNEATYKSRLKAALLQTEETFPQHAVTVEELPPSDLPFEERLATMKQRNALRIAHARAQAWQTVRVPIAGPYGICWFGDPHLDDPFCDLDAFERDARTCATTEGLYGVNGGDSINNWVGKLERLYGEQSATVSEGWELVEWALKDLGVNWLLWILGNHDTWNYGKRIFDGMNTNRILMRDWDAKLNIVSPCGGVLRAWARHDFKGHSMYNELHGNKRAAMIDEHADIYAAFHRHTFATGQGEFAGGRRYTLIRAKGYKESDSYALKGQFAEQTDGQSVVTIIQPRINQSPLISVFEDVQTGADFLTFLRRKV
jgi:hypothetical protein